MSKIKHLISAPFIRMNDFLKRNRIVCFLADLSVFVVLVVDILTHPG